MPDVVEDVKCNHCGRSPKYGEDYLVVSWMYMHESDLENHGERIAEFCKKCSALPLVVIHRHIA